MIGGFSQGAALALYVASKLTPDTESVKNSDEPESEKEEERKIKRGPKVKSEYQSQLDEPFSKNKLSKKI